jgi:hypothetical protein
LCIDANALAGIVETFINIDALVIIIQLETFGAKAFKGAHGIATNIVTRIASGALVNICECHFQDILGLFFFFFFF